MLANEAPQMMRNARAIIRNLLALLSANSVMRSHQHKAAFFFQAAGKRINRKLTLIGRVTRLARVECA